MYEAFACSLNRRMDIAEATTEHCRRCYAVYGLIARGTAAIPYALGMLANKEAEIRQDGSDVLGELGRHPHVVDHLVTALENETNQETIETLVAALGRLRAKKALPVL